MGGELVSFPLNVTCAIRFLFVELISSRFYLALEQNGGWLGLTSEKPGLGQDVDFINGKCEESSQ